MAIATHWKEEEFDIRLPDDCDLTFPVLAGEVAARFRCFADSLRQEFHILVSDKQLAMLVIAFIEARGSLWPADGDFSRWKTERAPTDPRIPLANESLGDYLLRIRTHKRLTVRDVARKSGLSRASVSNFETGRTRPRNIALLKVCDALGVSSEVALTLRDSSRNGKRKIDGKAVALTDSPATLELTA